MGHQMVQEGALWPSDMIRHGPHWRKVKWAGIINYIILKIASYKAHYCYNIVRLSCMAQSIIQCEPIFVQAKNLNKTMVSITVYVAI